MGKLAFVFPGQGSQYVGMGKGIYEQNDRGKQIFEQADQVLDFPLSRLCFEGPEDQLKLTENTQPAILTVSLALLEALRSKVDIQPDYVAGHSLGEYSALVASGALRAEDAVQTVRKRGQFMEEAVPAGVGGMAAVLGMERDTLHDICRRVSEEQGLVQLANLNCPGQIVISGSAEGVEAAGERAKEEGAKRVLPLNVSGPFHSSLMEPAAKKLTDVLKGIAIRDGEIPVIANAYAEPVLEKGTIQKGLIEQVISPVLWEDSVRWMLEQGTDTFVEIGPGKVLSGLVRKVQRRVQVFNIEDMESLHKVASELSN